MNPDQQSHLCDVLQSLEYPSPVEITHIPHSTSTDNYILSFADPNQPKLLARYFRNIPSDPSYEYRVLSILHEHDVPVPRQIHFSPEENGNQPFILMEYVEGTLLGQIKDIPDDLWDKYIDTLIDIHRIDLPSTFPTAKIPRNTHKKYAREIYKRRANDAKHFGVKKPMKPLLKWMKQHSKLEIQHLSLLHGDYHPFNIVVTPHKELVVLDWEGLDIGDNRRDLAFALLTAGSMNGRRMEEKLLSKYQASGLPVSKMEYYYVTNAFHRVVKLHHILSPEFEQSDLYLQVYNYLKTRTEEITGIAIDLEL